MSVYLDHASTTPLRPEARDAWLQANEVVGNASSIHGAGQAARRVLEDARERLAELLDADPIEVVFTSGGTESINLGIKGLWGARQGGDRIVSTAGEHHATLDALAALGTSGAHVDLVPLDANGVMDLDAWAAAVSAPGVSAGSLLAANTEVGAVQPLTHALEVAGRHGIPVHVDAVGSFGHLPLSVRALRDLPERKAGGGLAALSVSGHKVGGPVGVGALVVARDAHVRAQIHGGGQQRGLRAGTQDVAGAAAFAAAAEAAFAEREAVDMRVGALRDRLEAGIRQAIPEAGVSAAEVERLPGHLHVVFPGAQGDSLLLLLDMAGIAVSTGSACQAGTPEPSHVLLAMGRDEASARSALRFTLGRTTTQGEIDAVLAALPDAYARAHRAGLSSRESGRF